MKKWHIFILFIPLFSLILSKGFAKTHSYGAVDFAQCFTESKYGKQEQESFENIQKQLNKSINEIKNRLENLNSQMNDPEFRDSLSPEAEKDFKERVQNTRREFENSQNQYIQLMQQENMKSISMLEERVAKAAEIVAKRKHFSIILRKDVCFFYISSCDVTLDIIKEMDQSFDKEMKDKNQEEEPQS